MINLLPSHIKEHYSYGRSNTVLRRWAIIMTLGLIGTILVTCAGLFYTQKMIADYTKQVAITEQTLKDQNIVGTQKKAADITNSLKLAVDVLSKEVLFSQLITQIGSVIPPNTLLTDLSISEVAGAVELTAVAGDYTSATQLQVNLEAPENKIFSKADILNITCSGGATTSDPRYPCSLRVRALFADDNPFLFINNKAGN